MKNTEEALKWIVAILEEQKIPFQLTGGFAARMYGSDRELADIDIDIPENRINDLHELVKEYVIFGPERYKDDNYDLMLMTLQYQGQEIDISPETIKIFDHQKKEWVTSTVDLSKAILKEVYGTQVRVIPVEELIRYKSELGREVDLEDLENLKKR